MNRAVARVSYRQETTVTPAKTGRLPKTNRRNSRRWHRHLVGYTLVVLFCGLFIAAQYSAITLLGKQVQQLRREVVQEKKQVEYLQMEVNQLQALNRIEMIATTKLGMQPVQGKELLALGRATAPAAAAGRAGIEPAAGAVVATAELPVGSNPLVAALTRFVERLRPGAKVARS
ncbi:MAG: cell division protein FtsL [Heliobacteriaceae bacterium]|nr:cell division protein FtsL [Heliobacteriaceae bacterium]MDD4588084.1 cell division protein FtsL [Heliobacteriaceae bacterium]